MRVTNKLNEVPFYPENADQPIVSTSSRFDRTVAWFVLKSIDDDNDVYLPHLKQMIEDTVQPRLEQTVRALDDRPQRGPRVFKVIIDHRGERVGRLAHLIQLGIRASLLESVSELFEQGEHARQQKLVR